MFDNLKLLAPGSADQVPTKIDELRDREALFKRACEEEVNEADQ